MTERSISLLRWAALYIATLGFIVPVPAAEPQSAAALLGERVYSDVRSSGKSIAISSSGRPSLLPMHAASKTIRQEIEADNPGILVEAAFVLPRRALSNRDEAAAELAAIYGLLRSVGSLEGIEYYSESRKTMRVFYAESYRIDGPDGTTRTADPPYPSPQEIPARETVFAFQRDLTFGANRYQYIFENTGDAVVVRVTNLTRMHYGILPLLGPGSLTTTLLIAPASDGIVFYAASGAHAPGLFKSKLRDSFGNRAEALFRWFSSRHASGVRH